MKKGEFKHTEETKKKLSELAKGRPSPRKGAKLSEETKEKLRQANLGKVGMVGSNNPMYGKSMSSEAKQKMRITNASKIREFTCIRCNKIKTCSNTGRLREICDECKDKKNPCKDGCGEFVKAGHYDHQFISGHNLSLIPDTTRKEGAKKSIETRRKNGTLAPTLETRKKISKTVTKLHKEGKYKGTYGQNHSKGERSLKPYLEPLGFIHSEDKNLRISNGYRTRYPDYYNPETKQIVEYFGTYWHRDRELPNNKKHKTPQEVIDWYFKQGWNCTVVWEDEEQQFIDSLTLTKVGD